MANPTPRRPRAAEGSPAQPSVTSRALSLLGAFEGGAGRLGLSEMARRAGLPVATAHRLAGELVEWGALERVGVTYVVGDRLWRLGLLAPVRQNYGEIAAPYMQDVLFVTQNVVNLFVLDGGEALLLERIAGTRAGLPFRRVGDRMPLHASAGGKVMLAFGESRLMRDLPARLPASTPHTVVDRARLEAELAEVRSWGFATTMQEAGIGNFAVAVPVLQPNGSLAAALGVVTQDAPPSIGSVVPVLRIAARSIARGIAAGHRGA